MGLRVDCYLVLLTKFKEKYPDGIFEVITSRSSSPLKPSIKLLVKAGIRKRKDGGKNSLMPFEQYKKELSKELLNNQDAIKRMKELANSSQSKDVFLICYERNPNLCHRSIVKELIENNIIFNKSKMN